MRMPTVYLQVRESPALVQVGEVARELNGVRLFDPDGHLSRSVRYRGNHLVEYLVL
jgi:hypothetical protein